MATYLLGPDNADFLDKIPDLAWPSLTLITLNPGVVSPHNAQNN